MKSLKSERHHWWPECVSRHWATKDGTIGRLSPNGDCIRIRSKNLGVIRNGHHIKMGRDGAPSPWDVSFERVFDKADSGFPRLISWLEQLERIPLRDVASLRQRFVTQQCDDEQLLMMTECAVSLAVRGPRNRAASILLAERLRSDISPEEKNALIGMNIIHSQRGISDGIGSHGKFVVIYSENREFIFGDGFFHNLTGAQSAPHAPKIFAPITPNICILVCRPSRYSVEPRLSTLVLDDREVDRHNKTIQVYSKSEIYFRSQQPLIEDEFRCEKHLVYQEHQNPIDEIINNIPGVEARNSGRSQIFLPKPEIPKEGVISRFRHLFKR